MEQRFREADLQRWEEASQQHLKARQHAGEHLQGQLEQRDREAERQRWEEASQQHLKARQHAGEHFHQGQQQGQNAIFGPPPPP